MDPIQAIEPAKDSSFAMLLEAQNRGWSSHYAELGDLWIRDGEAWGRVTEVRVQDDAQDWFELGASADARLAVRAHGVRVTPNCWSAAWPQSMPIANGSGPCRSTPSAYAAKRRP